MYKILSLDGGGLKGLYTIKMLSKIEKEFNINLYEYFDLVIGTSTGSVIATLIALGKNADGILDLYMECYKKIFNTTSDKLRQKGLFSEIYSSKNLYDVVDEYLKDYDYEDLKTELIIPSVDYSNSSINIIKSTEEIKKENRFSLVDAIVASSSASGFFNPHIVNDNMYIDGSIYCNNPSLIGFSEAFKKGIKFNDIKVLSIGTGYTNKKNEIKNVSNISMKKIFGSNFLLNTVLNSLFKSSDNDFGLISMGFSLVDVTMRTSVESTDYILKNICNENQYVRINDYSKNLKLDKIPKELLNSLEENYVKNHKDKLEIFFKEKTKKSWFKNKILRISEILNNYANK